MKTFNKIKLTYQLSDNFNSTLVHLVTPTIDVNSIVEQLISIYSGIAEHWPAPTVSIETKTYKRVPSKYSIISCSVLPLQKK